MRKRLYTIGVLLCIFVPLIIIEHEIVYLLFLVLIMILGYLGGYELMKAFSLKSPGIEKYRFTFPLFSSLIILCHYISKYLIYNYLFFIMCSILFTLICMLIVLLDKETTGEDLFRVTGLLFYTGVLFSLVLMLRYNININVLNENFYRFRNGLALIYVYSIVVSTDTAAMLIGMSLGKGKKKLCPNISPNKTIIGAISGLVFGTITGTLFLFFLRNRITLINFELGGLLIWTICGFLLSAILSIAVQLGDLLASKIKRAYELKDFSNILPGHGGVLDRFDSLIFSTAVFYFIMMIGMVVV